MSCFKRRAVIWLLAFVMPFQVLTAVYLDVRGPLHFHVAIDYDYDHHHDQAHAHSHGESHAERHHHHPHQKGVVTVHRDGVLDPLTVESEIKSGWSSAMLAALLASCASFALLKMESRLMPRPEPFLQSRFLGRLERPPRTHLV